MNRFPTPNLDKKIVTKVDFTITERIGKGLETYITKQLATLSRFARSSASLTQEQVAGKLGITQARIKRLENANDEFAISTLAEVAVICGGKLNITFTHPLLETPATFELTPENVTEYLRTGKLS